MDFFEHQDVARKNTGRLVFFFVAAVIAIMVVVYLVVAGVIVAGQRGEPGLTMLNPVLMLGVGAAVLLIVGGGSAYKVHQLRGGGVAIAELLGGRLLHGGMADAKGRRLLNIVDEMAIASGTPAPSVYLMPDEQGINAFAAGHTPEDAVIGVTAGCLDLLDRDELQGVVAHEFSHILNGDMGLNIKLMGVLHGILVIGLLGQIVLRSLRFSGRSRSSGKGGGGGVAAVLAIAVGLLVVGYVGVFFGNLIKSAVSRQREYLADASAVQFTRNPGGIAGALKKIGGWASGSLLASPNAAEASHMYFGTGLKFGSLFATHPPLPERIRRIDPGWDGSWPEVRHEALRDVDVAPSAPRPGMVGLAGAAAVAASQPAAGALDTDTVLATIGQPTEAHLDYARQLMAAIPDELEQAAHEPYGARAVVYALIIAGQEDGDGDVRRRQTERLARHADEGVAELTARLLPQLETLESRARLPLVDLLIPSLRALSPVQFQVFRANVRALIRADERLDLFEWMLLRCVRRHVAPQFERQERSRSLVFAFTQLAGPVGLLLSAVARAGEGDARAVAGAFLAGAALIPVQLKDRGRATDPAELDAALDALAEIAPPLKKRLIAACARAIVFDRQVTVAEAELLRAVADGLGCPMPPLLPGQALSRP